MHLDHKIWIEPGYILMRITALVGDQAGAVDHRIQAGMRVPVDPKRNRISEAVGASDGLKARWNS